MKEWTLADKDMWVAFLTGRTSIKSQRRPCRLASAHMKGDIIFR